MSLTLTPLMCARLLKERGRGVRKTWVERVIGGVEKRVLGAYGRSLWWFLRRRWVSALIWLVCLAGTAALFVIVPKAFLPVGDSCFVSGVLIGREGSSPRQMREFQDKADRTLHEDPNVLMDFTVTGVTQFLASNQGLAFAFLKAPAERPPIEVAAAS